MKENVIRVLKSVFGYGITAALFGGGLSFFGYLAALCIGGATAEAICTFIYKQYLPVIVYISTTMILIGLVILYLSKDHALTSGEKPRAGQSAFTASNHTCLSSVGTSAER